MTVKNHTSLVEGKISSTIWRNSQPMFMAILLLLMYELLESGLIALSSTATLTAFGFTVPITAAMTALAVGTSIRCNNKAVKSACLDRDNISLSVSQALFTSGLILLTMTILALTFSEHLLQLLGNNNWLSSQGALEAPNLVTEQSSYINNRYLTWIFLGTVWQINGILRALNFTQLASNIMVAWIVLKGSLALLLLLPQSPLYFDSLTAISIVHAISDISFTLISLYILHSKIKLKLPSLSELKNQCKQPKLASILVIGQQLITPLSLAILTLIAASYSHTYVAAFALIFKLEAIILLIPMALTTSMPAIIGFNYWTGHHDRVKQAYRYMFATVLTAQFVIAVALSYSVDFWATSLCPHDNVTIHLKHYLTWLPWGYIGAGCVIVYQSTLNAKDKAVNASILGIIHRIGLVIPLSWFALSESEYSLYPALTLAHLLSGVCVFYLYRRGRITNKASSSMKDQLVT
ncbi:MATE family efflux transporter [Colwellia psychrerythraea]|uniref:Multi antimicrobial extrusion protein MatE n=1 Tax=Colwellia psychrerythraea TaxID=28229 RepID=A0A099KYG1_COLPS|nr:MATE family efflux transporter [Colwellia psychrerythraea]KGJ95235.1 multi antimicrobial extrusion protein MatE [Colwellia psychrerythraea]